MKYYRTVDICTCLCRAAVVLVVVVVVGQLEPPSVPSWTTTSYAPTRSSSIASKSCRAMFTVDKGGPEVIWASDEPYSRLSDQLPTLLLELKNKNTKGNLNVSLNIFMGTRLQFMNGTVPYLPCKIRSFSPDDVGECSSARSAHGAPTWIAFVGDSTQRQKIHTFITFLPSHLHYTYYLGDTEVNLEGFIEGVAHHQHRPPTFDIIGRRPSHTTTASHPNTDTRHASESTNSIYSPARKQSPDHDNEGNSIGKTKTVEKDSNISEPNIVENWDIISKGNIVQVSNTSEVNIGENGHKRSNGNIAENSYNTSKERISDKENQGKTNGEPGNPYFEVPSNDATMWSMDYDYWYVPIREDELQKEPYELRVSVVWATGAKRVQDDDEVEEDEDETGRNEVGKMEEWLAGDSLPDVVVIGLGTWLILSRQKRDELSPFPLLEGTVHPILDPLSRLAARTHVLYWAQSRYRWFNAKQPEDMSDQRKTMGYWQTFLYLEQFQESIPLTDAWLWGRLRTTGAWLWDSALPFNLANLRECLRLYQAKLYIHPVYRGRWWNCNDIHHSSYETNAVEIQMLLNLLCNEYTDKSQEYCCSGK